MKYYLATSPDDELFRKPDYRDMGKYHSDLVYMCNDLTPLEKGSQILVEVISCDKRFESIDDYMIEKSSLNWARLGPEYRLLVKINKIFSYNEIKKLLMLQ